MKKKSSRDIPINPLEGFDPVVPCAWLPDREVRLSEYNKMLTHFVQKYAKENPDAIQLHPKKFTDRQK